jgi:hypothetical protein
MRYLLIFMLLVGIFVLGKRSCILDGFGPIVRGTGPLQTETRDIRDFHAIEMDLAGNVELRVADTYAVRVTAQGNILPLLQTELVDGTLRLYFSENVHASEEVKIEVSAPAFDALSIGGSGAIQVLGPLRADRMALSIGGSGDIRMPEAELGSLDCDISGSGNLLIGGTGNEMEASISGSGEVDAKNLKVNVLRADISGAGNMRIHVNQQLKASISGSGEVLYGGEPSVESSVSGSGSVRRL